MANTRRSRSQRNKSQRNKSQRNRSQRNKSQRNRSQRNRSQRNRSQRNRNQQRGGDMFSMMPESIKQQKMAEESWGRANYLNLGRTKSASPSSNNLTRNMEMWGPNNMNSN